MTTALYKIETSEADDGTPRPAEQLCTPSADDAAELPRTRYSDGSWPIRRA